MSIIKSSNQKKTEIDASTAAPMLTPDDVLQQLRALRQRIPQFVQLPKNPETHAMRRRARLNVAFAREAFGAVGASDLVQGIIGNSAEELHQAEDEMARWTIVESELSAMLSGVAAGNLVRRERIAHAALQAYNLSSQLVKQEEYAYLLPHVERMKRLPKFGRRRSKPDPELQPPAA
ncbi:MAG TPA: hypothetical protein VGF48_13085 [Thermoanaerobaculia bacterium]|jgi:hypothetical protein